MKKNIWILIVVVANLVSACSVVSVTPQTSNPEAILNSTVQITMWVFMDGNDGTYSNLSVEQAQKLLASNSPQIINYGLGTLVEVEGRNMIMTHNHWVSLTKVGLIQFANAEGELLISMTPLEYEKLIIFQDAGTTILSEPANLGLAPAVVGSFEQVTRGQMVSILRRQPGDMNRLEVVEAMVEAITEYDSQEAWTLQAQNGDYLAPGDSGGGLWLNGQWIGNTWAIALVERANGEQKAEGTIYVAQCPPQVFTVVSNYAMAYDAEVEAAAQPDSEVQIANENIVER